MYQNDPENSQTRRSIKTNKISIEFVTLLIVFAGIFADITEDLMRDFADKQGNPIDVREALYDFTTKAVFIVLTGKKPLPGDLRYEKAKVIERGLVLALGPNNVQGALLDAFPFLRYLGNAAFK